MCPKFLSSFKQCDCLAMKWKNFVTWSKLISVFNETLLCPKNTFGKNHQHIILIIIPILKVKIQMMNKNNNAKLSAKLYFLLIEKFYQKK